MKNIFFTLKPNNNNTLKCEIFSKLYWIDFKQLLPPNIHSSNLPVKIIQVRTVHMDCCITVGAFHNSRPSHIIYEFAIEYE